MRASTRPLRPFLLIRLLGSSDAVWLLVTAGVLVAVKGVAELGFPLLTRNLVDHALARGSADELLRTGVGFAALALAVVALELAALLLGAAAVEATTLRQRRRVFAHAVKLPEDELRAVSALIARDVPNVASLFGTELQQSGFQIARLLATLLVLAALSPPLLLLAPFAMATLTAGPVVMRARIRRSSDIYQAAEAEVLMRSTELLNSMRAIVATGASRWALGHVARAAEDARSAKLRLMQFIGLSRSSYFGLWVVYAATYVIAGMQMLRGELTLGTVLAVGQVMGTLALPGEVLGAFYTKYLVASASLERSAAFLTRSAPTVFASDAPLRSGALPLRVDQVTHRVGTRTILHRISCTLSAGDTLAVVGPTGSGKSSLALVIGGFVDPSAGVVRAGGAPMRGWREDDYRAAVSVVWSETPLYHASVRENLVLGRRAGDGEILRAIKTADATEIIARLGGLDAVVDDTARQSTGERQRLAIARALVRCPHVLVLDEATNGLDAASEEQLVRDIRAQFPELAILLISHRLSSILLCERALVLEAGRVVEAGDTSQLMRSAGTFASLVSKQVIRATEPVV